MRWRLAAMIVVGLVAVGLGAWWLLEGLERANQLASVLGGFAGLAGLGITIWAVQSARRRPRPRRGRGRPDPGGQSVTGSYIGGNVTQAGRNVRHNDG